jgi:hypothetical protein
VVEQGTHKPLVGGSNPPATTNFFMDRKTLKEEYKQNKVIGGIYRVTNTRNGKYLFNYAPNIQAKQNAFEFAASSNTVFDNRLRGDWESLGGGAFSFEVLETLEKKKDQTQEQFITDLEALAQMWNEKLESSTRY